MLQALADLRTARVKLENSDDRPEPSDVAGRIRETARHQCANELRDFLRDASGEELRLMWMIMQNRSGSTSSELGYGGLPLATAFQEELDYDQEYMRIPRALSNEMHGYLESLMRATLEIEAPV